MAVIGARCVTNANLSAVATSTANMYAIRNRPGMKVAVLVWFLSNEDRSFILIKMYFVLVVQAVYVEYFNCNLSY